jgi:flagellar motor switch/type III secretory pathway protein FliN
MGDKNNVADIVTGPVADISDLPVRMDIVLAEREFTLREIQEFDEGSIVEVDGSKLEPVQVKLNGRTAGDGELVEIDGRLGVRILRWRHAQ